MSSGIHNGCVIIINMTKGHLHKADYPRWWETGRLTKLTFLLFTSLCFALFRRFWWLDWILLALNPAAWRTFIRHPTMISKEGPLWRSRHFLSHLWVNRKTRIQRYLCLSGSTPRHLWLWFILVAGTCWIKVNGSGRRNPDAKWLKRRTAM